MLKVSGSYFSFFRKLNYIQGCKDKHSNQEKSDYVCPCILTSASLCAYSKTIFSYTVGFCSFVLGGFFWLGFFVPPHNKTPASISAQDGRHTEDEELYNEQAVHALFAAKSGRRVVRQQQLGKERRKHCLVVNATGHHFENWNLFLPHLTAHRTL